MELEAINAGILSIVPPVVAIVLALVTKEVVFSLVLGILSGTTIYAFSTGTGIVGIFDTTTQLMATKLGDNTTMIIFLCLRSTGKPCRRFPRIRRMGCKKT
mgnify:CR=1 FL=1